VDVSRPKQKLTSRVLGSDLGKHTLGDVEAPDGSRVLGEVKERAPGPDPTAIPWLLLNASRLSARVCSRRRAASAGSHQGGGITPTESCSASNVNQFMRVPYTATYYFYRSR
jgi:hypothetical protein